MPVRYLKPGVRDSEAIDLLDAQTEVFFYRLLVTVDDFGRFDARPAMLKAQCFPIKDSVSAKDCEAMLVSLVRAGLVFVYESSGSKVLQVHKWDNKPRASASKYPECTDDCIQMYTDVCTRPQPHTNVALTETETETETETVNRKARSGARSFDAAAIDLPAGIDRDLWERWVAYRKRKRKPISEDAATEQIAQLLTWSREGRDLSAIISQSIANDWVGLFAKDGAKQTGSRGPVAKTFEQMRTERTDAAIAEFLGEVPGNVIEGEFTRGAVNA